MDLVIQCFSLNTWALNTVTAQIISIFIWKVPNRNSKWFQKPQIQDSKKNILNF